VRSNATNAGRALTIDANRLNAGIGYTSLEMCVDPRTNPSFDAGQALAATATLQSVGWSDVQGVGAKRRHREKADCHEHISI